MRVCCRLRSPGDDPLTELNADNRALAAEIVKGFLASCHLGSPLIANDGLTEDRAGGQMGVGRRALDAGLN